MLTWFKSLFRPMTILERAKREYAEAHFELLEARTAQEYAESAVRYNETRAKRLGQFLKELQQDHAQAK